jgi:glycine amidinotransferase
MDMTTRTIGPDAAAAGQVSPVNSHNEWDPLEEVIVGKARGCDHPVRSSGCHLQHSGHGCVGSVAGRRLPLSEDHDRTGAARA